MTNKLYVYTSDMSFDFLEDVNNDEYKKANKEEVGRMVNEKTYEWFQKAGECNVLFQLCEMTLAPASMGTTEFKVIGTIENLLKWNKEVWGDDIEEFQDNLVPFQYQ